MWIHELESEAVTGLLSGVVDALPIGVNVWCLGDARDPGTFRLMLSNNAAQEYTGVPRSGIIGKTIAEAYPAAQGTATLDVFSEVLQTGRTRDLGEVQLDIEGLPRGTFWIKVIPLAPRCVGVLFQNLSQQRRLQGELLDLREALEARAEQRVERSNPYGLTFREYTVLEQVVTGKSDKEIGDVLGISATTASRHVSNILKKMGASSRTEAGVRAVREGLTE